MPLVILSNGEQAFIETDHSKSSSQESFELSLQLIKILRLLSHGPVLRRKHLGSKCLLCNPLPEVNVAKFLGADSGIELKTEFHGSGIDGHARLHSKCFSVDDALLLIGCDVQRFYNSAGSPLKVVNRCQVSSCSLKKTVKLINGATHCLATLAMVGFFRKSTGFNSC